jgi:hypothetical protein
MRHTIAAVRIELRRFQPATWLSGVWKSTSGEGLDPYLRGLKTNPIKKIAIERTLAHGIKLHLSQYRSEITTRLELKLVSLAHTTSVMREFRKRAGIADGALLQRGFWSKQPEEVLSGANPNGWWRPVADGTGDAAIGASTDKDGSAGAPGDSTVDSAATSSPRSSGSSLLLSSSSSSSSSSSTLSSSPSPASSGGGGAGAGGGLLHDILFGLAGAGDGAQQADPAEAAYVLVKEHFTMERGERPGEPQQTEFLALRNGALEVVHRAPDGAEWRLFMRRVSGGGGSFIFNAAKPKHQGLSRSSSQQQTGGGAGSSGADSVGGVSGDDGGGSDEEDPRLFDDSGDDQEAEDAEDGSSGTRSRAGLGDDDGDGRRGEAADRDESSDSGEQLEKLQLAADAAAQAAKTESDAARKAADEAARLRDLANNVRIFFFLGGGTWGRCKGRHVQGPCVGESCR